MSMRVIHLADSATAYSSLMTGGIRWVTMPQFVLSPTGGHWSFLQFYTIVSKGSMNTRMQLFGTYIFFFCFIGLLFLFFM